MSEFATRVVHVGYTPDATGALMPAIYANSTFIQSAPGEHSGFEYGRSQNPTRFAFERAVADLESGSHGFAFASGLAAMATVLDTLPANSHIIASADLYGGSWRLFERVRAHSAGLQISYSDFSDAQQLASLLQDNTRMVWIETPSNPLLRLVDLDLVAQFARQHQLISVADNTFASPWTQRPLEHGFDIVLHSATKYLNGHSDVIAGVVVASPARPELAERLGYLQNAVGSILDPFSSFLALRGLRTLSLRMAAHSQNAQALAEWLEQQPEIEQVFYPGLPSHPQHALAQQQMRSGGGVISIRLKGDAEYARQVACALKVFTLAESLGGVESLICQPSSMTHGALTPERRAELGISPQLLRLSVGIEALEDLKADLAQALRG